jgi:hypothetical protein
MNCELKFMVESFGGKLSERGLPRLGSWQLVLRVNWKSGTIAFANVARLVRSNVYNVSIDVFRTTVISILFQVGDIHVKYVSCGKCSSSAVYR